MQVKQLLLDRHYSSREGGRVHLLVLHTTEGSGSLEQLRAIFEGEEASSHYGVDAMGQIGQFVPDAYKAWTQCNFNPVSLSLEQIGFAAFTRKQWFERHEQLHSAAEFLLYGHHRYGVLLRQGKVSGGGVDRDGVVQHRDLGLIGCGHSDCGDGYPIGYVILLAQYFDALHRDPLNRETKRKRRKVNAIRKRYGVPAAG